MKRRISALLAVLVLTALLPVYASAQDAAPSPKLSLTAQELELVEASKASPVRIGVIPSYAPLCYYNEDTCAYEGIIIEMLNTAAAYTGLRIEYIWIDMLRGSPPEQVKAGTQELVAGILKAPGNLADKELVISDDLARDTLVMVGRQGEDFTSAPETRTIAVMGSFAMARQYVDAMFPSHQVARYDTQEQCLLAVKSGEADATPYMRTCMNYMLQNPYYKGLEIAAVYSMDVAIGLAGSADEKTELVALIDKGLGQITENERNRIMMDFTIKHPYQPSMLDLYYEYRAHIILGSLLLVSVVAVMFFVVRRAAQKKAARASLLAEQQLSDIIHTVPCGICMYRLENGNFRPVLVNQQFRQMLGEDAEEYLSGVNGLDYTHAHPDDMERLRREVLRGLNETHEIDTTYRSLNPKLGKYIWMRMRGSAIPQADGSVNIYVSYYDVTQERMAEHLADIALESSGVSIWEYNYERRCIIQYQNSAEMHGFETVIPDVPQSLIDSGFVHPDSAADFLAMYDRLFAGEPFAEGVFRVQTADRKGWWYEHIRYTNEFDHSGKPVRAAGMSTDETEKQETIARYRKELELKKSSLAEEKLIAYAMFDLTARKSL